MKKKILTDNSGEKWTVGEKVAYSSQTGEHFYGRLMGLRNNKKDALIKFNKIEYLDEKDQVGVGKRKFITVPIFTVIRRKN